MPRDWRLLTLKGLAYTFGWALVAVPTAYHGFITDERETVIAGHDATVAPTLSGYAVVDLGAYLPNVRYPTDRTLGVTIEVGKTNLDSYEGLLDRYALIGSHPEGEVRKVTGLLQDMLLGNAMKGALIGLAVPGLWLLLGARRRKELLASLSATRVAMIAGGVAVVLVTTASDPFNARPEPDTVAEDAWQPVQSMLPETTVVGDAQRLEIQAGLITQGTRQLLGSAFDTYTESVTFYDDLRAKAPTLTDLLHQPDQDETVALLVTDRHDNVGMDRVARAIGDAGGATVLFDAGDDTSTGEAWEAFSLDSLIEAFEDYDEKYVVPGNHDNGSFVGDYLGEHGFSVLKGDTTTTDDDIVLLGAPDPRSSGLGSWRNITGLTLNEQREKLADTACTSAEDGERVNTLLVHDASVGSAALARGCVDLVLGGHLHVQVGPNRVQGTNGEVGATYTNGTTGGAAYALALGSKLRREAQVTLITYRDGIPIGLQPVTITTIGTFDVEPYVVLPSAGRLESAGGR